MSRRWRMAVGFLLTMLSCGLGFVGYRLAVTASRSQNHLSPQEQAMQDELAILLPQLPPGFEETLGNSDAFDLRTRLFLARGNVLLERLTDTRPAAAPFDEAAFADFEAELAAYKPLDPTIPDSDQAVLSSLRAQHALTVFQLSWAIAGPFSPRARDLCEREAIRLSTDRDVIVRQQCALLLWVISNLPTRSPLSSLGAQVLEHLRTDPFIRDTWNNVFEQSVKPRMERAGRTWPKDL